MAQSASRIKAKQLLRHYLNIGFEKSGYIWTHDNSTEVEDIVDCIVDAAVIETAEELRKQGVIK